MYNTYKKNNKRRHTNDKQNRENNIIRKQPR